MQLKIVVLIAAAAVVQARNRVKNNVIYTATGAAEVFANHEGCANITPQGAGNQFGCIGHVYNDGFTAIVKDTNSGNVTMCSIAGGSGFCGRDATQLTINVDLSGPTSGNVPPPSGPNGTTKLTPADLKNLPIPGNSATPTPASTITATGTVTKKESVTAKGTVTKKESVTATGTVTKKEPVTRKESVTKKESVTATGTVTAKGTVTEKEPVTATGTTTHTSITRAVNGTSGTPNLLHQKLSTSCTDERAKVTPQTFFA